MQANTAPIPMPLSTGSMDQLQAGDNVKAYSTLPRVCIHHIMHLFITFRD